MTVYIAEYLGMAWLRAGASQFPSVQEPSVTLTQLSSAGSSGSGMSTIQFGGATRLVRIASNTQGFFYLIGSSTISTGSPTTMTSTVMNFVPGGAASRPTVIGVSPYSKLFGWSS